MGISVSNAPAPVRGEGGAKIRKGSSMMGWLAAFASEVLSNYKVHANGRATYEMTTGHCCKLPACGSGEKVNFKTTTYKTRKNKIDTEWDLGYFLGWKLRSTEYLVGTSEGIISCTTMRRLQDDLAYDKACLDEVSIGYRDFVCNARESLGEDGCSHARESRSGTNDRSVSAREDEDCTQGPARTRIHRWLSSM